MEESLARLAHLQLAVLDDLIRKADGWTWGDAYVFSLTYQDVSPYLKIPKITDRYKAHFRADAEQAMWMEWALYVVDMKDPSEANSPIGATWSNQFLNGRVNGNGIMRRLAALGVPTNEYRADSYAEGKLDLRKMAKWAQRNKPRKPPEVERVSHAPPLTPCGPQPAGLCRGDRPAITPLAALVAPAPAVERPQHPAPARGRSRTGVPACPGSFPISRERQPEARREAALRLWRTTPRPAKPRPRSMAPAPGSPAAKAEPLRLPTSWDRRG